MSHHIVAIEVRDIQRLRHVQYKPAADTSLILIGGKNAQGKTSLLRALEAAFGGAAAVPADPVRHGAEDGEIVVQLDDGITIRRRVEVDGKSKLEITSSLGSVKSPQAILDKLVAGRMLDPLAFLQRKAAEQRAELLKLIDRNGKIAGIDSNRAAVFSRRTEVGRDLKKAEAQLAGAPEVAPEATIDVAALQAEQREAIAVMQAFHKLGNEQGAAVRELELCDKGIAELEAQIAELQRRLADRKQTRATAAERNARLSAEITEKAGEFRAACDRRDLIDQELQRADAHNRKAATDAAAAAQRKRLAADVENLRGDHTALTEEIERYDAEKAAILAAAELPVPGLGINENAVTLNGVPLEQASGAERWRVAVALAIAGRPQLRDVWIKDGALLDDDSLAALGQLAQQTGYRFWIERVGNRDPGAVIIHDGEIVTPATTPSQQLELGGVQ